MSLNDLAKEEEVLNVLIVSVNRQRLKACKDLHLFRAFKKTAYISDVYFDIVGLTPEAFYECSECKGIVGPTAYEWWKRGGHDAVKGDRYD